MNYSPVNTDYSHVHYLTSYDKLLVKSLARESGIKFLCIYYICKAWSFLHYYIMLLDIIMQTLVLAHVRIEFGCSRKCQSHGIRRHSIIWRPSVKPRTLESFACLAEHLSNSFIYWFHHYIYDVANSR